MCVCVCACVCSPYCDCTRVLISDRLIPIRDMDHNIGLAIDHHDHQERSITKEISMLRSIVIVVCQIFSNVITQMRDGFQLRVLEISAMLSVDRGQCGQCGFNSSPANNQQTSDVPVISFVFTLLIFVVYVYVNR